MQPGTTSPIVRDMGFTVQTTHESLTISKQLEKAIQHPQIKMKSTLVLALIAGGASAYAPAQPNTSTKKSALSMANTDAVQTFPTVNGWTADPSKFCAGLPGAIAPLGEFDPLGFTKDLPVQEIKRFREAEVTHGRVAMLAVVGYLVAEHVHPLFNGAVFGPANTHLTQVQEVAPFFFAWLVTSIGSAEILRALNGWESPRKAITENNDLDFEGKTWFAKLNDNYYPGDIGFDPLGLKPTDAAEFAQMQTKELQNGRLAMIAAIGMMVQEQVTHNTLF